ncbi:hypothetical protein EJ06DRAFT_222902 [Trichodelitschia bisporula]|uniref:Uncharacterized protein n=1 Tax=Trichodelitschia bisporula TaxID=703511 RepID=A0A6G1HL79_9PEZI|nr:hypothetical protein EJ06DRAFT_222902 [Trichodelitschia bisporula]
MSSRPKQKTAKGRAAQEGQSEITDPRFRSIQTDPRFRLPSKKHTHVKLDKRFAKVLKDDDFSQKASVDRYGRKIDKAAGRKDLERLYKLESDEEDEDVVADDDEVLKELRRADKKYDPARDGGFSSSEEDSDSDEEVEVEEEVDEAALFPSKADEVPLGEISSRLAVVNLDWDNIRAVDLLAVASSFAPADGKIINAIVYPSEFGRERMDREELEGPPREIFNNSKANSDSDTESDAQSGTEDVDSEDEEEEIKKRLLQEEKAEDFDPSALRRYQLDRLKYYYAVLTCSSPTVAKALYDAMDGREYLSSANFFDLRFIPDDVSFDDEAPRDEATTIPTGYRPTEFVTDALTHSRVKLTWDAEDTKRKEVQKRAFSRQEMDENDLQAYIGSASESEESEAEAEAEAGKGDRRAALRAALGLGGAPTKAKGRKQEAPVGDMQISFTPGLSATAKKGPVFENEPIIEETTAEQYIRKERERKAKRKEKARAQRLGLPDPTEAADDKSADEAKPTDKKDKKDKKTKKDRKAKSPIPDEEDPFNDPFFTDPVAALDAAKKARKAEKARLRAERAAEEAATSAQRAELELLMDDNTNLRHFDMREVMKAEKEAKRGGKKGKNRGKKGGDDGAETKPADNFKMDVHDPRFSRLFESHEFAIDPTNPRFKGTEGMKALLEEGRRKRAREGDVEGAPEEKKARASGTSRSEDITQLVEKVKNKSKH